MNISSLGNIDNKFRIIIDKSKERLILVYFLVIY